MITKKQILENKTLLNEDFAWWETLLMGVGFVPVIGEVADMILIGIYLYKKEYLWAGLMLVALFPTVGDILVKPFIRILKSSAGAAKVAKVGIKVAEEVPAVVKSESALIAHLSENPKLAKMYKDIVPHLDSPIVEKTAKQFDKLPGNLGEKLRGSMNSLKSVGSKILKKPIGISKSIGKELELGKSWFPAAKGLKNYFRGERLSKYFARTGQVPDTWLKKWYNIVYLGYKDRRTYVRNFIVANKFLDIFGIPNLDEFERKFATDSQFRTQVSNNEKMSEVIAQTTSQEDENKIAGIGGTLAQGTMGLIGLPLIKFFARTFA